MLKIRKKKILYNLLTLFSTLLLLLLIAEGISRFAGVEKYGYDLLFKETDDGRVFIPRPNANVFIKGNHIEINSDGLRDYEYSKEKSKDAYRIAVLGASFAFGGGINLEETYSKILEYMLNKRTLIKYDVINFGVPGYSITQQEARLIEDVIRYNPDMIIVYLGPKGTQEFIYIPFKDFLKRNSYLFGYLHEKYATLRFILQQDNIEEKKIEEDTKNKTDIVSLSEETINENFESFKNIITYSKKNNIKLIVLNYPLLEKDPYKFIGKETYNIFINYAEKERVVVVDMVEIFERKNIEVKDLWISEKNRHPNKMANTFVAEELFKVIVDES